MLDDWTTDATSILIKSVRHSLFTTFAQPEIPLVGIQAGAVHFKEKAAMVWISAILRNYFNLCAAGAPELGVVGVGGDAHFLDGFFVWRDGSGSAPIQAIH